MGEKYSYNKANNQNKSQGKDDPNNLEGEVDNIGYHKNNSVGVANKVNEEFPKRLERHKNSKSSTNLVEDLKKTQNHNISTKEGENQYLGENLSGPTKKSILSQENEINNEKNTENNVIRTLDINIKEVAPKIKPLHEDYSQEEIDRSIITSCSSIKNDYELNFYRNGEEIRKSYISKLICKKVWMPSQKEKTHNSLIIFDWDDTLLCTTFLTPGGVFNENMQLSEEDKRKIRTLEFSVLRLLTIAVEKGEITLSKDGKESIENNAKSIPISSLFIRSDFEERVEVSF